jgi:branched-chain amino acid transport system ATP-binding protein
MLVTDHISKSFGGLKALDDVTLNVDQGEIVALIGPNGAGKTTLFSVVSGFLPADEGRVTFEGTDITNQPPHRICRMGLARTFQLAKPFSGLSVRENIAVGAYLHLAKREALAKADEVASLLQLAGVLDQKAAGLSVAFRKRLELARALATGPRMLLLDEVFGGLNPTEIESILPVMRKIRDTGVTIVLIEHVMQAVMQLSDRIVVLNNGRVISAGAPEAVAADPVVVEAYLGTGAAAIVAQETSHA